MVVPNMGDFDDRGGEITWATTTHALHACLTESLLMEAQHRNAL